MVDNEQKEGRFLSQEEYDNRLEMSKYYVDLFKQQKILKPWLNKQTYIALGSLLLSAGLLKIDATPIEGFDSHILDRVLKLDGYSSSVIVSLGYRSENDLNSKLKKARLDINDIIETI